MHSYDVIRRAAEESQREWIAAADAKGVACDKNVRRLKFSDCWVKSFLGRFNLSRQRITSTLKANRPPPAEVQRVMADIQRVLVDMGFALCDI